jgi:anaerobic magnesium-protoporphyrin IX monomethyl ester cyclase
MSKVLLIYPYFKPNRDRSVFRFPPLGVSYLAASLQAAGYQVDVLDCTFMKRAEARQKALEDKAEVVGIYCMVTMLEDCLWLANELRPSSQLLVAGGPLATCDPHAFFPSFDVVIKGEAEITLVELMDAYREGKDISVIQGVVTRRIVGTNGKSKEVILSGEERPFVRELDRLPFPARGLLPNDRYIQFGKKRYGYSVTTVMSTRGCPYECEFCSNVIFGGSYRERSAGNVVDEIEQALALGYDRISFADDVFTLHKKRVLEICAEIKKRGLNFYWECLGRVDSLDHSIYAEMYRAGCRRIYFGIESGDETILKLMKKKITPEEAKETVVAAHQAGLEVGAFFILFYPGETNQTVLNTLRFANSLPVDYLGLTMPYPLPGTALYERVKDKIKRQWHPGESIFGSHVLTYEAEFSEAKMWFGIIKGQAQFQIRRRLGKLAPFALKLFEPASDWLLVHLK